MPFHAYVNSADVAFARTGINAGIQDAAPQGYEDEFQYFGVLQCTNTVPNRRTHLQDALLTSRRLDAMYDIAWCGRNLPAGWQWSGTYYLLRSQRGHRLSTRHECFHCAVVELQSKPAAERSYWYIVYLPPGRDPATLAAMCSMPELATLDDSDSTAKVTLESAFAACGKCGRVGHNVRSCKGHEKHHDMVGIEVEGRWNNLNATIRGATAMGMPRGYHDSSVSRGGGDAQPWEFQTTPGTLATALNQLHAVYPDEADNSCGMHVHVSWLSPLHASLLGTPEFYAYFKERWTAWGTANNITPGSQFWQRLNGRNSYCRPNTRDSHRTELTNMDRYHQLNFSAWGEHKTIECRLLPMFRSEALALSAVQELLSIYEDFLSSVETRIVMPAAEAKLERPTKQTANTKNRIEGWAIKPEKITKVIEVNKIDPPAPGMTRVVVAGGNFTYDVLKRLNEARKAVKHVDNIVKKAGKSGEKRAA